MDHLTRCISQSKYEEQVFQMRLHGAKVQKLYNFRRPVEHSRKKTEQAKKESSRLDDVSAKLLAHVIRHGGKRTPDTYQW